ncbi:hypothetical protein [Sorangium sp. So ce233]|uniref:hypothetical protein n=1 Tax=Sorangium sp. So ce233 TaxID=3133290 RepID=UPI003F5FA147
MAPGAALSAARRCIAGAIQDPVAAAWLLDLAIRHIAAALNSVTPATPEAERDAVQAEADELALYIQCFE